MALRSLSLNHAYAGAFASYSQLPNVAGASEQTDSLEVGDQASVNGSFYICTDATPGAAVWSEVTSTSNATIRGYGDTLLLPAGSLIIVSPVDLLNRSQFAGNNKLIVDFDTVYFRTTCRVRLSNGVTATEVDVQFANLIDICSWLAVNVPSTNVPGNSDVTVTMSCFDTLDKSIPMVSKWYGKNRFYASLFPRGSGYWNSSRIRSARQAKLDPRKVSYLPPIEAAFFNAFEALFGPGSFPTPSGSWSDADFGVFWMGGSKRTRYDIPGTTSGFSITMGSAIDRFSIDPGPSVAPAQTGTPYLATGQAVYLAMDPSGSFPYAPFTPLQALKQMGGLIHQGFSFLCLIALETAGGSRAVYMKPVGIDFSYMEGVDEVKYQVEMVGYSENDLRPHIVPVPLVQNNMQYRAASLLDTPRLFQYACRISSRQGMTIGRHSQKPQMAKLQLRDLSTNKVSVLSSPTLQVMKQTNVPYGLQIRNRSYV